MTNTAIPWQLAGVRGGLRLLDRLHPELAAAAALELFTRPLRRRRSQGELIAAADQADIPFPGGRVRAYAWGAGPAVLLVHGWETDAGTMAAFVGPLLAAGFQAVAIDGPAHGRSSGGRADLPAFSAAIQAAAERYGPLAGVVAHSFGVAATLWMLAQPGPPPVGRVALISGPADVSSQLRHFIETVGLPGRSAAKLDEIFVRRYGLPADSVDLARFAAQIAPRPSLVIHDRGDRRVGFGHAERIAAGLPGARLLATEGLGHNRILRDAGVTAAVAQFMATPRG